MALPVVGAILMSGTGDTAAAFDIVATMETSVNKVQGDALRILAIVIPAIVVVVGAVVVAKFGIGWLKKIRA